MKSWIIGAVLICLVYSGLGWAKYGEDSIPAEATLEIHYANSPPDYRAFHGYAEP